VGHFWTCHTPKKRDALEVRLIGYVLQLEQSNELNRNSGIYEKAGACMHPGHHHFGAVIAFLFFSKLESSKPIAPHITQN
jgi:hypothetical protein